MNKMYLVLGDWSDDGHGKSDKILVECNKTVKEIQDAYKASCKLTGISFNHNEDYTELKRDWKISKPFQICAEYDNAEISEECLEVLKKFKCPIDNFINECYVEDFISLWFWFVSLSLSDLEWNEVKDEIPVINGYWNDNLNVQFGYGLYM